MAIVAYLRVSSTGQSLDVQRDKAADFGVDKVFEEKRSGVDRERPALAEALRYVREGDTLIVTKIDRLARSTVDLLNIVRELEAKGVHFKALDQSLDMTTLAGKLQLQVLAAVAEFENNLRKERQADGIRKARENGVQFGPKAAMTSSVVEQIRTLRGEGALIKDIIKATGLSKASVYRALAA